MDRPRVIGVGRFGVRCTGLLPNLPETSAPAELATFSLSPDAGVATALRAARALGCAAEAWGTVGDDPLGAATAAALTAVGVDARSVVASGQSPIEMAWLAADGQRRVHAPGDPGREPGSDALAAAVTGAAAILIDGTAPVLARTAARTARAAGRPVVLRPRVDALAAIDELLAESDVLIASERVVAELAPRGEVEDAARELARRGPSVVILTLGRDGAIAWHDGHARRVPSLLVEALGDHGAGAVFQGAFTAALLSRQPLLACVTIGNAAAALACRALTPWDGVAGRDEVLAAAEQTA